VPDTFAHFANVWALREDGSGMSYDKVSLITSLVTIEESL